MTSNWDDRVRVNVIPRAPVTTRLPDGATRGHLRQSFVHVLAARAQSLQHLVYQQEGQEDRDLVAVGLGLVRRDLMSVCLIDCI